MLNFLPKISSKQNRDEFLRQIENSIINLNQIANLIDDDSTSYWKVMNVIYFLDTMKKQIVQGYVVDSYKSELAMRMQTLWP